MAFSIEDLYGIFPSCSSAEKALSFRKERYMVFSTYKEKNLISRKKELSLQNTPDPSSTVHQCSQWALEKKALNVISINLEGHTTIADYFLLMSANSKSHAQSLAEYIRLSLQKHGVKPIKEEGFTEGRWILLDAGDFVVHIFQDYMRDFYALEDLWSKAPQTVIQDEISRKK